MTQTKTKGHMMRIRFGQYGGTLVGFVAGLVLGLAVALAVAVYVTKVPIPFMSKAVSHNAEQDASEVQKNKDWDPNAPLYGKNPVKPVTGTEVVVQPPPAKDKAVAPDAPAAADPLGDLAKARAQGKDGAAKAIATKDSAARDNAAKDAVAVEPFIYFVQIGAFRTAEDAEAQRAKLSLAAVEAKVSEREQAGRIVFRVRTGPYDKRDEADKAKAKLDGMGLETALVRVQR
jgi:cell division protein FtsN